MKKIITLTILLFSSLLIFAQMGTIRGTVFDNGNGQTLIGANVIINNTLNGSSTDIDGQFSIKVKEGVYDLKVSFISYEDLIIKDIEVKNNEVTVLNNIQMKQGGLNMEEVQIVAEASRRSNAAMNTMKKKSIAMMDGISAEKMALTGDATAVDAAKRVTGVSVEGGKYVYVRGLGDRYSKVTLNQMDIPGLDPDKNSMQMDMIPTNLIDNIIVSKNFTADMPSDFTGGLMNIETKAFPEKKILDVSIGVSYNPDMHFNKEYLDYKGGSTDFLGMDDGTRALPKSANSEKFPTPFSGATEQQVNNFVNSFNPVLGADRETSLMDYSFGFSFGNQKSLAKNTQSSWGKKNPTLGYIFSLTYKTEYEHYDDVIYGEYLRSNKTSNNELIMANMQSGEQSSRNVLLGGLAGLAYKTNRSKIRFTLMRLQSGQSTAGKFSIENSAAATGQSGYIASSNNIEYNERSLTNAILHGKHIIKDSGWEIDWKLSPTLSTSNDPDIRRTAFTYTHLDTFFNAGAGGNPTRIWRNLEELNASAKMDLSKEYKFLGEEAKLKFGGSYTYKERDYEILKYDMQFWRGTQDWDSDDPNDILDPNNVFPSQSNGIYYQSGNSFPNSNAYQSDITNKAAYISNEMDLNPRLKTILGLRMEYYVQKHTGRDQAYASGDHINGNNLNDEVVLESLDFFPSVNLIYKLAEEQNLRFAYSKTIARPSFKELSFAQIMDPLTGRMFNGALFEYPDWRGELTETRIDNLDLRWEKFMERGEIVSASMFYKQFDKPIELVRIPEQQSITEIQPRNVGTARLVGVELEATKRLDFISDKLSELSFSGNITFVRSEVDMTTKEFDSRKAFEKQGEKIKNTRAMAGQAPYVLNLGFTYKNPEMALQAGLFYNVKGPSLQIVGTGLVPDVYQEPFHSLNLGVNKQLGEEGQTTLDFKISNILGDRIESVFQSYEAENQIFSSLYPGRSFSVGVSHQF